MVFIFKSNFFKVYPSTVRMAMRSFYLQVLATIGFDLDYTRGLLIEWLLMLRFLWKVSILAMLVLLRDTQFARLKHEIQYYSKTGNFKSTSFVALKKIQDGELDVDDCV